MPNDFKIKFEYKGIGKKAGSARQDAIKASKFAGAKEGGHQTREFSNSIKGLASSIQKLVASNKSLEAVVRKSAGMGGVPGGGGGGVPGLGGGGGGHLGGVGAIVSAGGILAGIGAGIHKINQIGSAYLEKTGAMLRNVGRGGGGRRAVGLYGAEEISGGMAAYATESGKWATGKIPPQASLNMSTIYGTPIEEALREAGMFERGGANYQQSLHQGLGAGIQTEIPMLMAGITSALEDATRDGINSSDMAEDMAGELAQLTMKTTGRSVQSALGIISGFGGVKESVSRGRMGESLESMYASRATKGILMKKLTGEGGAGYLDELLKSGMISEGQRGQIAGLGGGATFEQLQKINPALAMMLFQKTGAETGTGQLQRETMSEYQQKYGKGAEAFQSFAARYGNQWGGNISQKWALWQSAASGKPLDLTGKGAEIEAGKVAEVSGSAEAASKTMQLKFENVMLENGKEFADTVLLMDNAMLKLAKGAAPFAVGALEGLGKSAEALSKIYDAFINSFSKNLNKYPGNPFFESFGGGVM